MFAVLKKDEVDHAIEQDRKQRRLRHLELEKDLENRRHEAHRRRWTLDEGPRTQLNWFETVSFSERCSDRWHAICDALTLQHRWSDPVLAYDEKLATKIETARAKMRIKWASSNSIEEGGHDFGNDDYTKETRQREIAEKRAEVVIAQQKLENLEKLEGEIGNQHVTALHELYSQELTKERIVFDQWVKKLNRPSYHDRLGDIQTWFKSKVPREADKSPPPHADSIWQRAKMKLGKLFNSAPYILVPAEVFFALPGFEFLTKDDKFAALMGAVIFTALLALLGHASAMFLIRGVINRVDDSDGAGSTLYRPRPLTVAFLLLASAVFMSFAGADLRGKLPDIAALDKREAQWVDAVAQVRAQSINDINRERTEAIAAERAKLATQRAEIDEAQRKLYDLNYSLEKTDKMIALWVYFALFLVSAGRVILSRDPIFEYELAASTVREREGALRYIEAVKEAERRYWRELVHGLRNNIAHRRAELGKIAPEDPLALPEVRSEDGEARAKENKTTEQSHKAAVHEIGSAHGKHGSDGARGNVVALSSEVGPQANDKSAESSNPAVETFEKLSYAWRRDRLQRYTQWYGCFSWYGLDAYAESRRKALARHPNKAANAAA
jgi:hypothetical protein